MGIVRDITVDQLTQAVNNIDTSTLAQDSTLQDVVTAISNISGGSDPVTNTTVNSLCKDTTGQSIASAISGLGATLGSDKANISGDNIANPSAFRSALGFGGTTGVLGFDDYSTGAGVSIPSGTTTDVYQKNITVDGVYLVQFIGNWDKKAGGSRVIMAQPNSKPTVNGGRRTANTVFVGTESTLDWFQEHIMILTLHAGDTMYFRAYQNSGSAITLYPIIDLVRIN